MLSVTALRQGIAFEEDGHIFEVLSYEHIKLGRGSATVKVKVKNLRSGAVFEKGFISHAEVQEVDVKKSELQFLYKDNDFAYFMDATSFEQFKIPLHRIPGYVFLREGEVATVEFYEEEPLGLLLSSKVSLKVVDTPPGVRGNSASNVYKDAMLENGIRIKVPLFINTGDTVVVDTRDITYTKRG